MTMTYQLIGLTKRCSQPLAGMMTSSQHVYEIRPRTDKRGIDLISDALPFGRLWVCRAKRGQQCDWLREVFAAVQTML
jgi:hypothetical protein